MTPRIHPIRTIAVIAPAGVPNPDGLARGMDLIRHWGYRVVPGRHLHEAWRYTAGTSEQRTADLRWALQDPDIDAVWLARGGFGVQHSLAALQAAPLGDKLVIGSSDATALFQFLWQRGHRWLVHGPMVDTLADPVDDATRERIQQVLEHPGQPGTLIGTTTLDADPAGRTGVTTGVMLGGNLTMLASLCGTPWALQAAGAILLLEDVTEHAFRLDRSLLQLRLSGALQGVSAIVLGEFVRCHLPPGADYSAADLVADLLRPLGVPIVLGAGFGHGQTNLAWPVGRVARLQGLCLSF